MRWSGHRFRRRQFKELPDARVHESGEVESILVDQLYPVVLGYDTPAVGRAAAADEVLVHRHHERAVIEGEFLPLRDSSPGNHVVVLVEHHVRVA